MPLEQKIARCEAFYADRDLPATFKLAPTERALDDVLAQRGYALGSVSDVQTLDLAREPALPAEGVHLEERLGARWRRAWNQLNAAGRERETVVLGIAQRAPSPCVYASLSRGHEVVALGFASCHARQAALHLIFTQPSQRGRGLGRRIVGGLLAWARGVGARSTCLQVESDNRAAIRLYTALGFRTVYRYWYRRRRAEEPDQAHRRAAGGG